MILVRSSNNSFRLLLVTARYFPFMGGIETHTYEVARRLARCGVRVTILTANPGGRLPSQETLEGVDIRRSPSWPDREDYYFAPGVYQVVREGGWDIVHCQGVHTFVPPLTMLAARRSQIPFVVTFHTGGHSSRVRNAFRGTQWNLLRPLLAHAERYVGVSQFEAEYFRKRLGLARQRLAIIPNGSDLPETPAFPLAKTKFPSIVSLGRLERYKGHHRIIAAMPEVLHQYPEAQLTLLGAGPYEAELRRLSQSRGVAGCIHFRSIPPADRQGMALALLQADLIVLLSECESHPVGIMEALALGRPALVANTSGLSELAERGWAAAIPLESNPGQVAEAVIQQIQRPQIPPSIQLPTWEECAGSLLKIYQAVLGGQ